MKKPALKQQHKYTSRNS